MNAKKSLLSDLILYLSKLDDEAIQKSSIFELVSGFFEQKALEAYREAKNNEPFILTGEPE